MVNFYVKQIQMGKMTIEQVPQKYRDKVREVLDADSA